MESCKGQCFTLACLLSQFSYHEEVSLTFSHYCGLGGWGTQSYIYIAVCPTMDPTLELQEEKICLDNITSYNGALAVLH